MTAVVLLSKNKARALTDRIREVGEGFAALLLEAYEGEAWRVLGYQSWAAYIDGEFEFNRQYSYRLLVQGRVNQLLAEAGSTLRVTEREARDLSPSQIQVGDTREIEHEVTARREQPSPAYMAALAEQQAADAHRKGGAYPKPAGPKRRGYQPPTERWRHWCEELEAVAEALGDDTLDADAARTLDRLTHAAQAITRRA